ncbi:MAG TPA: M15 family metallopeptidase [Actinomycetota bacterium]|nr:M15 family metallopeptidase [Actinomycetota bacterium]
MLKKVGTVVILAITTVLSASATRALAEPAWDQHYNYPPHPTGRTGIEKVFGKPCTLNARLNSLGWRAADDGKTYIIRYHKRLGGTDSSNLHPDVRMHHYMGDLDPQVRRGIWGYNCRKKRGGSEYSTHAYGIAVDINSAYEHLGHYHCHTVTTAIGKVWQGHGWRWGNTWGDCMHFQYASGY